MKYVCVILSIFPYPNVQIKQQCEELELTDEKTKTFMTRILAEINRGLKKETHAEADIKCFVTYVQDLPNGKGMAGKINEF